MLLYNYPKVAFLQYCVSVGCGVVSLTKGTSLHVPGKPWIIAELGGMSLADYDLRVDDEYKILWKAFFNNIAIKERINPKLQRNNLPIRFRRDMTEFEYV